MRKRNALKVYMKYEGIYVFVLRAWRTKTGHAKKDQPAICFASFLDRQYLPPGVKSAHSTYTADGDAHRTIDYADGKRVHIFRHHVSVTKIPRVWNNKGYYEALALPTTEELENHVFDLPAGILPPFESFMPDQPQPLGYGMAYYLPPDPRPPVDSERVLIEEIDPEECEIIETDGLAGSLNFGAFLCSTPTPREWKGELRENEERLPTIIWGEEPPYFGVEVTLFREKAESVAPGE